MPTVSVIIPVYNTARYLQDAIESILCQDINDIEILCVNDGSTDNSLEILQGFANKDKRILVFTQPNQGQSIARNTALKYATGKYLYFMDSDDILLPTCFSTCIRYMEENKYDFVFFDGDIFCEEGAPNICWDYKRTQHFNEQTNYVGTSLMEEMLTKYAFRAVPWLLFIKKEYLERTKLSFYPGIIHEDELFTTLATIQSERIGCIKQSFVKHRVRANSTMSKAFSRRNLDCYLKVIEELQIFASKHNEQIKEIINHYCKYTLDKVFYTAHILPFTQKIKYFITLIRKKYTKFVSIKTIGVFLLKK